MSTCPVCGERCTCSTLPESANLPLSTMPPDMGSVGSSVGYGAAAAVAVHESRESYPDENPYTDPDLAHAWVRGNMAGQRNGVRRVIDDLRTIGFDTRDFVLKYNAILHAEQERIAQRARAYAASRRPNYKAFAGQCTEQIQRLVSNEFMSTANELIEIWKALHDMAKALDGEP